MNAGLAGFGIEFPAEGLLAQKGLPAGVLATSAVPGTEAARVHFGDVLITRINGAPLEPTMRSYCNAIHAVMPGERAVLSVIDSAGAPARLVTVRFG